MTEAILRVRRDQDMICLLCRQHITVYQMFNIYDRTVFRRNLHEQHCIIVAALCIIGDTPFDRNTWRQPVSKRLAVSNAWTHSKIGSHGYTDTINCIAVSYNAFVYSYNETRSFYNLCWACPWLLIPYATMSCFNSN